MSAQAGRSKFPHPCSAGGQPRSETSTSFRGRPGRGLIGGNGGISFAGNRPRMCSGINAATSARTRTRARAAAKPCNVSVRAKPLSAKRASAKSGAESLETNPARAAPERMIGPRAGTRVWLAAGVTHMRCGMDTLAAKEAAVLTCCRRAMHQGLETGTRATSGHRCQVRSLIDMNLDLESLAIAARCDLRSSSKIAGRSCRNVPGPRAPRSGALSTAMR